MAWAICYVVTSCVGASITLCLGSPPQPHGKHNSISHYHCGLREELPNCTLLSTRAYKASFYHQNILWPTPRVFEITWGPRMKASLVAETLQGWSCAGGDSGASPSQWDALSKLQKQEQQHHFWRTVYVTDLVYLKMRWTRAWKSCLRFFSCKQSLEKQLRCKNLHLQVWTGESISKQLALCPYK